jgi:hypothetical protein
MGSDILLLLTDSDDDAVEFKSAAGDLCSIVVATDVAQCAALVSQSPSIIVLSDRLLSDRLNRRASDIASACAEIRKETAGTFTPVLVVSDSDTDSNTDTDGVIRRPVQFAVLAAWLQAAQCMAQMRQNMTSAIANNQDHEQLLKSFAKLSHAVNNPLQALFATVDMLLLNHGLSDQAAAMTTEILTHADRVAKLVAEASGKAKQALKPAAVERPTQVL